MTSTSAHYYISQPADNDLVFAFAAEQIILREGSYLPSFAETQLPPDLGITYYCFANLLGRRCLLVEAKQLLICDSSFTIITEELNQNLEKKEKLTFTILDKSFSFINFRQIADLLPQEEYRLAVLGKQLLHWRLNSQFCGHCGNKVIDKLDERAKLCINCNLVIYPRLSPVVIVLITRGLEILLARSPHFKPKMYSAIAGFVELGEPLEQAIHREVKEEIGISVKNIQYISSQSWPFPDSLMIGFLAEYDSGEILIDLKEIEDAAWFSLENLPLLPSRFSIAYQLISYHFNKNNLNLTNY